MSIDGYRELVEGQVLNFDHLTLWVGNAQQAATYYCICCGFEPLAYRGLETGSRSFVYHVVRQADITLQFVSSLNPGHNQLTEFLIDHGDGVRDVAFRVDDATTCMVRATDRGASIVKELTILTEDGPPVDLTIDDKLLNNEATNNHQGSQNGSIQKQTNGISNDRMSVKIGTVKTFGDVTHTFIERGSYTGLFLPSYKPSPLKLGSLLDHLPDVGWLRVDHAVGQFDEGNLEPLTTWYEKTLNFHRFWSVDESVMHTEYSGLRSHIMSSANESVKMPLCEVISTMKSRAQEYIKYNSGAGIHHVAFYTEDIVQSVTNLMRRGVQFLRTPSTYYEQLRERLAKSPIRIAEDLDTLERLSILVDFDDRGYLLQIFTRPQQDRPTLVLEVIQRRGHDGFGAGNFLALFKAIEAETALRGNL